MSLFASGTPARFRTARIFLILLAGSLALSACGKETGPKAVSSRNAAGETGKTAAGAETGAKAGARAVEPPIPEKCALNEAQDVRLPDGSGRSYSDSRSVSPGHWELTDERFLPPVSEDRREGALRITASRDAERGPEAMVFDFKSEKGNARCTVEGFRDIGEAYPAGGKCLPRFTIRREADREDALGTVTGTMYFADIADGDDAFGQQVTVRDHFQKQRTSIDPLLPFIRFGTGEDEGRSGSAKPEGGKQEFYFSPAAWFPQLVAEGDRIFIVLEIADGGEGLTRMRNVWEYTWTADPLPETDAETASGEKETHPENDPEWIKEVYPGHWDRTNVIYAGGGEETASDTGVSVRTERRGVDGEKMCFVFSSGAGADGKAGEGVQQLAFTIPEERFPERCYAGEPVFAMLEIFCEPGREDLPGQVLSSLAFCTPEETGENELRLTPAGYFSGGYLTGDVPVFGPVPHGDTMTWHGSAGCGYLSLEGSFPEGHADGEKLCLVYSATDRSGSLRMYDIYEYEWTAGPDVVWRHNLPGV